MIHHEYSWESDDLTRLYGQSWMPDDGPRAVINYVHGFKDHSSRMERWAIRFTQNGFGLIALDLRGHGRSEGRRGYARGFRSYLEDVHTLRKNALNYFGNVPHILFGHSLGGNIVANYLITKDLQPKAAIITSPWFTLADRPPLFVTTLAHVARIVLPNRVMKSDLDAEKLSHDPEVAADYRNDPLVHNFILPRLYFDIERYGMLASRSIYKINVPILVMQGTADRITSYRQTRDFVQHAGNLTTFKDWPGAYHELHNETCEREVFDYMLQWLDTQLISKS